MEKFTSVLLASAFLLFSANVALADDPVVSVLDRNAVWTKGKSPDTPQHGMAANRAHGSASAVSFDSAGTMETGSRQGWMDFINETKTYDYKEDHGNSA